MEKYDYEDESLSSEFNLFRAINPALSSDSDTEVSRLGGLFMFYP